MARGKPVTEDADGVTSADLDMGILARDVGFQVHITQRAFWSALRSRRRKDVPREPSGYFASLILIGANPGISQTQLADELVIDPPNVALILARMTEGGLVERTQDPSDRRRILLTLTPAGEARMQDALEFNSSQRRLVELALSAEEIGQLNGLLGKLRQFLRNAERLSGD